jgi:hypothetical protein
MVNKTILKVYFEDMDYSAVYLQPNTLEGLIESHRHRPIVKIASRKGGKAIYRKMRGKAMEGLSKDIIGIDHISLKEMKIQEGDSVSLAKANLFHRYVTYFRKHPDEDIRGAWWYFAIGLALNLTTSLLTFFF